MSEKDILHAEMEFITGTVTSDMDYLLYLLLKNSNTDDSDDFPIEPISEEGYMREDFLDNWFDNL